MTLKLNCNKKTQFFFFMEERLELTLHQRGYVC